MLFQVRQLFDSVRTLVVAALTTLGGLPVIFHLRLFLRIAFCCFAVVWASDAWAQEDDETTNATSDVIVQDDTDAAAAQAQMNESVQGANAAAGSGKRRRGPPNGEADAAGAQPGQTPSTKPGAQPDSKLPKSVLRSDEPPSEADPNELKVRPNENGTLEFQFRDQPWPAVLRWLAKVSDMSLDWQELPGDTINLATRRPYSLEETKDMINRALLMRGYTILEHDSSLTIAKTDGINPSVVPRVRPDELPDLPPHSFVRTSFELTWMLAEDVHSEFSSMLSKNGTLTPLMSTNRIEAMDAVGNLSDIYDILAKEQSAIALGNLAEEYRLKHARASQVQASLEQFLGTLTPSAASGKTRPRRGGGGGDASEVMMQQMQQQMAQQQQEMQQQMQQMQQAAGGGKPGGAGAAKKRDDKVYLFANDRSNTLIVHAPPDKRAIIAAFIKRVDVPNEQAGDFERMKLRTKVFRLVSLSPQELVTSLNAMDILEPSTRLQINEENSSLIVYASLSDQYLIQEVIDRLDGSQRSLHMIQLRRLSADAVAGTIKSLMLGDEEDEDKGRNRYRYYGFFGENGSESTKKTDKMRVTANIEDNQLLLWVNEIELDEVKKLLERLGEIQPAHSASTMRVVDATRRPETYEYLKKLKTAWDKISPNPLVIPDQSEFQTQEEPSDSNDESDKMDPSPEVAPAQQVPPGEITASTNSMPRRGNPRRLVASQIGHQPSQDEVRGHAQQTDNALATPPISIDIDDRGNLVIQSDDTAALDRLEQWMLEHKPPRRNYDVFKLKFAKATWVRISLKEYFDNQEEDSSLSRPGYFFFDYYDGSKDKNKNDRQLGKRAELQFIADNDTNTIVVKNADDRDRSTIAELIKLWDVPDPREKEEDKIRYTKLVALKYSRANLILNTVKEAYRDLLSANDKTFEKDASGESKREDGSSFGLSFKGKLSLGADEVSNRILVSAEGQTLFKIVCDMIAELDEAAKDQSTIQVIAVAGGVNSKSMKDALQAVLPTPKEDGKKNVDEQQKENQEQAESQQQATEKAARKNDTRNGRR